MRPKVTKIPPGGEQVKFQQYQFDTYLGEAPGTTRGLDLSKQVMGSDQCITDIVCRDLANTYKALDA